MVDIMGVGVLIEGAPGIGKSETALALIERGHSLVADDITVLNRERSGTIMCTAVDVTRYHMEIRGLGLIHVPSLFGVASMRLKMKLDLIVKLLPEAEDDELDRTGLAPKMRRVMGVDIPLVVLPVAAGRDSSLLIEAAALNQKLKVMGHDAAKELDQKIIEALSAQSHRSRRVMLPNSGD
jgi:HPr kinase/phosphorylase